MFNGPFKIYELYQIVLEPIIWDSATNAIKFYVQDFPESIPYVSYAHEDLFFTTYRQTKTTKRRAKKFFTNVVEQICNRWLVRRVLERKNAKRRRNAVPHAYLYTYAPSVRANSAFFIFKYYGTRMGPNVSTLSFLPAKNVSWGGVIAVLGRRCRYVFRLTGRMGDWCTIEEIETTNEKNYDMILTIICSLDYSPWFLSQSLFWQEEKTHFVKGCPVITRNVKKN